MASERRLHPLSIPFGLLSELRAFVVPALAVLVTAGSTGRSWEFWAVLLVVPGTAIAVVRYLTYRYRFEDEELVIRSGLVFRNERHVPYARIQNLESSGNPLHRLCRVVEVRIDTGAGADAEATIRVVSLAAFDEMRARVFAAKAAGGDAAGAEGAPAPELLLRLSPGELVRYGLVENRGMVIVGAGLGALWEIGIGDRWLGQSGVVPATRDAVRNLLREAPGTWDVALDRVVLLPLAIVAFLLLTRVLSVIWAFLRLHGFTLTRQGDDVRMEYGLLTRVSTAIPLRRIQTITVRESLLHRWCGRTSVRVDTAGGAEQGGRGNAERAWLGPIIPVGDAPALVKAVAPEIDIASVVWHPPAPGAFRRALKVPLLVVAAISLGLAQPFDWWTATLVPGAGRWNLLAIPLLIAGALFLTRQHVAHLGWAVTDGAVFFRSGWLQRQMTIARFTKIQVVALDTTPFDRRAAMARVRVDTAGAGDLSHRIRIPYLPRDTADQLCARLSAEAAHTAFRW